MDKKKEEEEKAKIEDIDYSSDQTIEKNNQIRIKDKFENKEYFLDLNNG